MGVVFEFGLFFGEDIVFLGYIKGHLQMAHRDLIGWLGGLAFGPSR